MRSDATTLIGCAPVVTGFLITIVSFGITYGLVRWVVG